MLKRPSRSSSRSGGAPARTRASAKPARRAPELRRLRPGFRPLIPRIAWDALDAVCGLAPTRPHEKSAAIPEPRRPEVLLAVSGGGDSVFLAHALAWRAAAFRRFRVRIAHVNHGVRGAESDADESFVRGLAEELGAEFTSLRLDMGLVSPRAGMPNELVLREARWGALAALARMFGSAGIVAAHTRNDLAETFLLHAMRGAGVRGLAGMSSRGHWEDLDVLRPLLDLGREEIRDALRAEKLRWREDSTNRSLTPKRNWVRLELLARMEKREPGTTAALARTAQICAEESAALDTAAARVLGAARRDCGETECVLAVAPLLEAPVAITMRAVRLATESLLAKAFPGKPVRGEWTHNRALWEQLHAALRAAAMDHEAREVAFGKWISAQTDGSSLRLHVKPHGTSIPPRRKASER